jgi:hypothetical protein
MVLTENLPMNFSSQPGFQNFAHLLLADKKSLLPDEDAVAKNILMLQQSLALTTKMLLARTRGVRFCGMMPTGLGLTKVRSTRLPSLWKRGSTRRQSSAAPPSTSPYRPISVSISVRTTSH